MMADPFSTIVGIIDLLDKAKKAYDKFKDAKDLPKAFGTISGQIDLATSIFKDVKDTANHTAQTNKIRSTVDQCEMDAKDLNVIYELVCEHINDTWRHRYKSHIATMKEGRKCEVEKIWKRILDGVHLLAADFGIQKLDEIKNAIKDIEKLPSSLEDDRAGTTINNSYGRTGVNGVNYGKFNMGNEYGGDHIENHGKSS
jgi:archaellum component FlaC